MIVGHVGTGFIVSAIAVFFYEWGAHIKKALELSDRLSESLRELGPIARATGEAALREGLSTLLDEDSSSRHHHLAKMASDIQEIVRSIWTLENEGIWIKDKYIIYLSDLLAITRQNAGCLQNLAKEGPHDLDVPSAELTDKLLVAQMDSLEEGDRYDVFTNLESWRFGRLPAFSERTRVAVRERGVHVRRIINLLFHVHDLRPDEVQQILSSQMSSAHNSEEKFQVKVLGAEDLANSDSSELKKYARSSHFGIFSHREERLRISLTSLELSKISMTTTSRDLDLSARLFNEAWNVAKPLTEELVDSIVMKMNQDQPL